MKPNYFDAPITKRFYDAFPMFDYTEDEEKHLAFWYHWENSPFYRADTEHASFSKSKMKYVYDHLLAQYYNWHFQYMDDVGILLNVFKRIEEYWSNAYERLELAKKLRDMSEDDYADSGKFISSTGQNPKTKTSMDKLIDLVDSQTATFKQKSQEQIAKDKITALYQVDGIMSEFIARFADLFVKLYTGVNDYIYRNFTQKEEEYNDND